MAYNRPLPDDDDDFGFSAVSEAEYNAVINETADTAEAYKHKLTEVEKLVLPFFTKLLKTSDKEYIYWPGRAAKMQEFIKKIDALMK